MSKTDDILYFSNKVIKTIGGLQYSIVMNHNTVILDRMTEEQKIKFYEIYNKISCDFLLKLNEFDYELMELKNGFNDLNNFLLTIK